MRLNKHISKWQSDMKREPCSVRINDKLEFATSHQELTISVGNYLKLAMPQDEFNNHLQL